MNTKDHEYLGDGVYVSHDGEALWLHVGSHRHDPIVALDRDTFKALLSYGTKYYNLDRKINRTED